MTPLSDETTRYFETIDGVDYHFVIDTDWRRELVYVRLYAGNSALGCLTWDTRNDRMIANTIEGHAGAVRAILDILE